VGYLSKQRMEPARVVLRYVLRGRGRGPLMRRSLKRVRSRIGEAEAVLDRSRCTSTSSAILRFATQ